MNKIYKIYKLLYETYGAQGWWPFTDGGYHPLDYSFPKNPDEVFEVCLGSILTQNTTFTSGYHNQKARYILEFIKFYKNLNGATPSRDTLLHVVGIGPETADSILLYGYNQLQFKVDAYTKRVLMQLGLIDEKAKYHDMKLLMEASLKECIKDEKKLLIVYQEFHALIVNYAKKFHSKKPCGKGYFLSEELQ